MNIDEKIEVADQKVEQAISEANDEICKLLKNVTQEIEDGEKPIELIAYRSKNQLEEIRLCSELKMQKAKNNLICSIEKDAQEMEPLANIEKCTCDIKQKVKKQRCCLKEKVNEKKEKIDCKKQEIQQN